jgi:hypothetical protein
MSLDSLSSVEDLLMNCIYTIAKKTAIGMAEMQDTNSKIIYNMVAISIILFSKSGLQGGIYI